MTLPRAFNDIVDVLRRVQRDPDAHIEIRFSILVVRVYPGRTLQSIRSEPRLKEQLKQLTTFILTLADELEGPTHFSFEYDDGELSIGVRRIDGTEVWMPCEIVALDRQQDGDPCASFSFLDDQGQAIAVIPSRRIRL